MTENALHYTLGSLIDKLFDSILDNIPSSNYTPSNISNISNIINTNQQSINNYTLFNYDINTLNNTYNTDSNLMTLKLFFKKYPYILDNLILQSSIQNNIIRINNNNIIFFSFVIPICLFVITTTFLISFKYNLYDDINVSSIIIENILTFVCVGIVEYWFFTTYAFNYNPSPNSVLYNSAITTIKQILSTPYIYDKKILNGL
jgi:hypothetical protein